jgi:hypothetical protein
VKTPPHSQVDAHHPMTFVSRGVAAPFTTPLLAGNRLRCSHRDGVEIVVPNPSGSRGVYVLHWPGVRALCSPTVHDTLLFQRCSRLTTIAPSRIRATALGVARQGYAGRDAAAAAEAAIAHDRSQALLTHFLLVSALVEQFDPSGGTVTAAATTPQRRSDLDRRAGAVLHRIAPILGRPPPSLAAALTALGTLFAPIGVSGADRDARIPRLLRCLDDAQAGLTAWLATDPANDIGGLGHAVAAALKRACQSGTAALERTRSLLADPAALLRRWVRDRDEILAHAARCDWLLDGWERIGLLWSAATTTATRRATLLEMAPLVPVLPREVTKWGDLTVPAEAMQQTCRVTSHQDGWRNGGSAFGLIERNERLIALSARIALPVPNGAEHRAA